MFNFPQLLCLSGCDITLRNHYVSIKIFTPHVNALGKTLQVVISRNTLLYKENDPVIFLFNKLGQFYKN